MTPTPVTTALEVAEDRILAALAACAPAGYAYWDAAPPDTIEALMAPIEAAGAVNRVYVAQHQDGGGDRDPLLRSDGWAGLVLVKVYARTDALARAGFALAVTAMGALTSPTGYRLDARFRRPQALPRELVAARGGLWQLTIRRRAT